MSPVPPSPNLDRRNFLRGRIAVVQRPPRPPGAVEEPLFLAGCTRCDDCLRACEPGILARGDGGFPEVDLARGGCTFCGECARACRSGLIDGEAQFWGYRALIEGRCLSAEGITCRTCGDFCSVAAIRFRLVPGGKAVPSIDQTRCNGCGACYAPCPTGAIRMTDESGRSSAQQPPIGVRSRAA